MYNKRGFNAKHPIDSSNLRGLVYRFIPKAFADEGETGEGENQVTTPQVNFETLIANARKEEKEKLYPRIKKLEDENKVLIQTNNDNLMKLATAQQQLEEMKANNGESQKVKDLEAQLETVRTELETMKKSTPNEEEIRAKIEAEYEVKLYRTTKLNENADKILSVFVDEVTGTSKEEIDSSFEKAVQKTLQTKKQLGLVDDEGNPIDKTKTTSEKKKAKTETAPPVANPSTAGDEKFDMDYVQNLDPSSPEYAEFRKKMGLR